MKVLGYGLGGAFLAIGLVGIARESGFALAGWVVWFGGAVLVHDAVLVPCVLLAGAATTRLPRPYRRYVQVAVMVSAMVGLVALPFVLGKGRRADNPSILPLPYGRNVLLVLVAVFVLAACVALWRHHRSSGRIAVAAWAVLIAGAFIVGDLLRRAGIATEDELPPLHAAPRLLTWQIVPAACVGAALVAVLPSLARRLSWRVLLPVSWAAAVLWTVTLALTDGLDAVHRPLDAPTEYPAGLDAVRADGPAHWLRTFTERLGGYTTHVRGHPPLPTLMLWALEETGLRGTGWSSALVVAAGTSAVVAIAVTARHVAGETAARRAVPFLALAPLTLWIATSMDAFFLGAGAWATALTAIASKRTSLAAAAGAGLLLGTLPYLSYGLLALFAVPLAVVVLTRPSRRVLAVLLCCAAVVPLAFTAGGFWWPDGVAATHETYLVSRGSAQRSYAYFLIANFAVLALQVGPATVHALPGALSRRTPLAWLAGAALAGVLALDVSGVTRGEVERIWLPYAAWVVLVAAGHDPPARRWLAAQAGLALAIQALVHSHW